MTPRVPLVCTPEAARQLFFALSDYFVTLQAGINDPARVLGLIDALFRPAEEPEVDAATRAEIEKGLAHSARGEVEPYTSAAPAAPCDHPAEDCLPEMTVGPGYGHLRCLRCGAFISPAPAAPPPAGEPGLPSAKAVAAAYAVWRGCKAGDEPWAPALSAAYAIDLAALRAENERLRRELEGRTLRPAVSDRGAGSDYVPF